MYQDMENNKWLWQPHKKGPIYIRVSYKDADGKTKKFTHSLHTSNLSQARKIRDTEFAPIILDIDKAAAQLDLILKKFPELEKKLQEGVHGGYKEKQSVKVFTLQELFDEWKKAITRSNSNYELAPRSAKRYISICNSYIHKIGIDKDLYSVTSLDITYCRDQRLEEGAVKKTVNLELNAVRNLFSYAVDQHGLDENPAKGVTVKMTKAERNRTKSQRPPSWDEADKICTEFPAAGHKHYSRDDFQDYALVARYTGMRQGEIALLKSDEFRVCDASQYFDVVLSNPKQHLSEYSDPIPNGCVLCIYLHNTGNRTTKAGEDRLVPVADKLLPVIKRRLKQTSDGYLFPFAVKDSGASFGRTWLKKVKTIDEDLTMHAFRHYCTSEMENNGVTSPISHIIVGHDPGSVHDDYFHKSIRALKEAVDKIY